MSRSWVIGGLVALLLLVWAGKLDRAATVWETKAKAATAAYAGVRDSLRTVQADLAQVQRQVDTIRVVTRATVAAGDTLRAHSGATIIPPLPDTCLHVVLRLQAARDTALQAAADYRSAWVTSDSALTLTQNALQGAQEALGRAQASGDTLAALLRSAPRPCRLLGVPCPTLGVGAIVGLSGGVQPGVALVIPLRF